MRQGLTHKNQGLADKNHDTTLVRQALTDSLSYLPLPHLTRDLSLEAPPLSLLPIDLIIPIFAPMKAYVYLYTRPESLEDSLIEVEDKLKRYTTLGPYERLDSPSRGQSLIRWSLPKDLTEQERYDLFRDLLGYIRQKPLALYYRGANYAPIKRIVADLDGCLVAEELLIHIARERGMLEEISTSTQTAMEGKVDFESNFKARVRLLKGMQASDLEFIASSITLAPGIEQFCRFTEGEDIRLDLASSNLAPYVQTLMIRLGASDYIATMPVMNDEEVLDGTLEDPIITAQDKKDYALTTVNKYISQEQTLVIGDGANDLLMLSVMPHALLYHSAGSESLNIADVVVDLYFRP